MSTAMKRHWHMLRLIPRAPRKIATAALHAKLESRGFHIDRRSIQRDLIKLSGQFSLVVDERSKPFGWSWSRDAAPFDIPGMDVHTALAFNLAAEHLSHLLPHATFAYMRPHFDRARAVLDGLDDNDLAGWRDSVRVLPSGQPLAPPLVDSVVLEAVHDGLLHRRQLQVSYQPRGKAETKTYVANPLALVYRDKIAYLVCALFDYDNFVQLAAHRLRAVSETGLPTRVPPTWDLDSYIEAGEFGVRVGPEPIRLVARLRETVTAGLSETPLAADQQLAACDPAAGAATGDATGDATGAAVGDGWVEVRATVADTAQLRRWLRAQGRACQVLEPVALRDEMRAELRAAAGLYEDG